MVVGVLQPESGESADAGLLRMLGIPRDTVRNIILTHDIVPRAFACDYKPIAALLRQLFTAHSGLYCDERSIMYHFVGRMLVLQPDDSLRWVTERERHHPLLPPRAGLYELIEPDVLSRTRAAALASIDALDSLLEPARPASAPTAGASLLPSAWLHRRSAPPAFGGDSDSDAACAAVEGYPSPCSHPHAAGATLGRQAYFQSLSARRPDPQQSAASALTLDLEATLGPELEGLLSLGGPGAAPASPLSSLDLDDSSPRAAGQTSLHQAELAMLDTPHPLAVLSDPGAYGDAGSISRFHHPDHYTQALGSVVKANLAPLMRLARTVRVERMSEVLRTRLRRAEPSAAWHSAIWELQAALAADGAGLDLRPAATLLSASSFLADMPPPGSH